MPPESLRHDSLGRVGRDVRGADAGQPEMCNVAGSQWLLEDEAPVRLLLQRLGRGLRRREDPGGRDGILHDRDPGVDRALARVLLVHEAPDHAGCEERDRHGHEDDDLEGDGKADPLEEHGEDETDRGHERRHDEEPQEVVLDRGEERVVGEERPVVVETDELVPVAVVEAPDDRSDRRVDDPDAEEHERRGEEDDRGAVALEEARLGVRGWKPPGRGFHRWDGLAHKRA